MKTLQPRGDWPPAWRRAYEFDRAEIYGEVTHRGYAYAYANRRARTLALLTEVVAPGARVLDLAAAQGNFSLALAERGYRVTWNDLRADLAPYVQAKHERGDVEYRPGNAFELQFEAPFDAVLATEVIEHVAHPDRFLGHLARLVRPGGWLIVTTPNGGYFRNRLPRWSDLVDPAVLESRQFGPDADDHLFLLHDDELERFAATLGLQLDRLEHFTNPISNGHLKLERALAVLPALWVQAIEITSRRLPAAWARRLLVHTAVRLRVPASPDAAGEAAR